MGSILDTVSKILKDTAIFVSVSVSKIHFTLRGSYRIFKILNWVKDTDTLKSRLVVAIAEVLQENILHLAIFPNFSGGQLRKISDIPTLSFTKKNVRMFWNISNYYALCQGMASTKSICILYLYRILDTSSKLSILPYLQILGQCILYLYLRYFLKVSSPTLQT